MKVKNERCNMNVKMYNSRWNLNIYIETFYMSCRNNHPYLHRPLTPIVALLASRARAEEQGILDRGFFFSSSYRSKDLEQGCTSGGNR